MPCPYNIIFGRDTALPCPLYHSDATGFDIMQTARGEEYFDIYEGRVVVDGQEYVIPVLAGSRIPESILGLQWLKMLPLAVNFGAGLLTLG